MCGGGGESVPVLVLGWPSDKKIPKIALPDQKLRSLCTPSQILPVSKVARGLVDQLPPCFPACPVRHSCVATLFPM